MNIVKFPVNGFHIFSNIMFGLFVNSQMATAQSIQTDGTTPTQPANCSSDCIIKGGLQQGENLFHSFKRFNVDAGATVLFQDPEVTNILSRITGNELSEILGTLGVSGGDANLFLLNPKGIIFGQDSSLDLNGSFLATTANAIRFGEQGLLDTAPDEIPLLTINPSALSFAGVNQGMIRNESIAPSGADISGIEETALGLRISNGKSFLLAGGDVIFNGGRVNAFGGRVELGGLSEAGEVQLDFADTNQGDISLSFPDQIQRANVSLFNKALINVPANDGGDIAINANNIDITEGSILRAGIGIGLGNADSQAGNIALNADNKLEITNSVVANQISEQAKGNGGDINISSDSLFVSNKSVLQALSLGMGDAGDIKIEVPNGLVKINNNSQVFTVIESIRTDDFESIAIGDGGDIKIIAQEILLEDSSFIDASSLGQGNTGNIDIFVEADLVINSNSRILSVINPGAIGNGGNINLEANTVSLQNSSFIDASSLGQGNAGNIEIFLEEGLVIASNSAIQSVINPEAIGDAGNINIEASDISLNSGSQLVSNVFGRGKGGNISLNISDSVNIVGFGTDGFSSGIFTTTEEGGEGQAGGVTVNTDSFQIADGGLVSSQTINESNGGSISINANNFAAIDGGQIATSAASSGDAGNINIQASENLLLSGSETNFANRLAEFGDVIVINEPPGNSGFFANVRADASGAGGNVKVAAGQLDIVDGAEIDVSAAGTGVAGSLTIDAQDITLDKGSLNAETRVGNQGNISLNNADTLLLRNNSQITTNASASATGGNITISAQGIAALDNSDITANAVRGQGGNIQITTQGIFSEPDSEITAASELGIDGTVTFNTPDVDPASGIYKLPDVPIDAENILAQDLCKLEDEKIAKGSSFIITGRGGLTPTSADSLGDVDGVVNWANREDLQVSQNGAVGIRQREVNNSEKDSADKSYSDIQQSQGLVVATDGSAWLTTNAYSTASNNSGIIHPDCGTLKSEK
ncbi:MAG: filamentous hemagglutinin N-terminal domain-containing protein [Pleurocapsa sp. SU_5_0]|nr:filamentous hemagglutinin N-terminal domain-containing protein [Pleurocapsa sp. SU_5_0]